MLTLLLMTLAAGPLSDSVDRGVSEALARERAAAFTAVRYDLAFTVPVSRQRPVDGTLRLAVTLAAPRRIVLDFWDPRERIHRVRYGYAAVVPTYVPNH